jgi:hypothetical protein
MFPARLAANKRWRDRNRVSMREWGRVEYERRREWYLWKARLKTMLMRIVRAHGDPPGC